MQLDSSEADLNARIAKLDFGQVCSSAVLLLRSPYYPHHHATYVVVVVEQKIIDVLHTQHDDACVLRRCSF